MKQVRPKDDKLNDRICNGVFKIIVLEPSISKTLFQNLDNNSSVKSKHRNIQRNLPYFILNFNLYVRNTAKTEYRVKQSFCTKYI